MAVRNNANQLTADNLGLSPSTPRLQELLHLAQVGKKVSFKLSVIPRIHSKTMK